MDRGEGQETLAATAAAMRELRDLKTDAEAKRELRNEVRECFLRRSTAGCHLRFKVDCRRLLKVYQ